MVKKPKAKRPTPNELDPLIHERLRLGILSVLAVQEAISFTELRICFRQPTAISACRRVGWNRPDTSCAIKNLKTGSPKAPTG
jgi:hypothetical protein